MMKLNFIIPIILFCTILFSCEKKKENTSDIDAGLIVITKAQFNSEKMELGEPQRNPFNEMVHFTGNIVPDVNGQAQISLPIPGQISKIYCKPSQVITKGTLLFQVTGNEFIDMQRDFVESSTILKRVKSEFERAKELHNENISSQKEFITAESAFYAEQAKYNALKVKLENMGLNVQRIESGTIFPAYYVKSPINGYVTSIDATIGQYVEPQQKIAEVIDAGTYQLKLYIFEKDINKITIGQKVNYYLNGNIKETHSAEISSVNKNLLNQTKTINCYAKIENSDKSKLINNQFAEGDIIIAVDSVLAVPQTAVISSEDDAYILTLEKETDNEYYFNKFRLTTGRKNNNLVEIVDEIPSNKIVIKGVYNVQIE